MIWCHPNTYRIKCNTNELVLESLGPTSCVWLFMYASGDFMGDFATNHGAHNSLYAELMDIILTIEQATIKG